MSSSSMIILQEQAFQEVVFFWLWRTNVNRKQRPYDQPDRNQLGWGYCRLFPSFYRCCNRKSYKIHDNTEIHPSNHTSNGAGNYNGPSPGYGSGWTDTGSATVNRIIRFDSTTETVLASSSNSV